METQNIEYKESWRDEYLKWICGFANAQGGTLYIGMNDKGEVVGVDNAKRLLEDIPNKVKNAMGIIVGVDLMTEDGKSYIRIETEPCGFPLNYKGDYYIRSGATLQTLQGSALTHFLLKRTGTKWDSVTVDNFTYQDLDRESFNIFRREALRSFVFDTCKAQANWNMDNFIADQIELIKKQVGDKKVLLALSGGVDSSVVAALLIRAIGDQLTCVHVNHGLLRKGEPEQVVEVFRNQLGANLIYRSARSSARSSSACSRRRRASSTALSSSARAPSIPTSWSPAPRPPRWSRATTTWAACPRICSSSWSSR